MRGKIRINIRSDRSNQLESFNSSLNARLRIQRSFPQGSTTVLRPRAFTMNVVKSVVDVQSVAKLFAKGRSTT